MGHPKGLFLLFGTEMWERFSYYGMRAILTLYLIAAVDKGGFGWTKPEALQLYAYFTMSVYLTPLIGGWLADNFLGQRKSIIIGGILMAAGQFTLGLPKAYIPGMEEQVFFLGLILLIAGNGFFKPNISTMVGDLYGEGDHRRDGAFTIFYMGINLGAFMSPLIVGYVAETIDWQYGFIIAGVGMLCSLAMQIALAEKYLGDIGKEPAAKRKVAGEETASSRPLTKEEKDRTKVILIMSIFSIIFWAGFEQAGGLFNIYAQDFTDRMLFGFEIPASWFQSVNALFIIIFAPMVASFWIRLDTKEPTSPIKFALAMIFLALGFLVMVGATMAQGGDTTVKVSMMYLIMAYLFHTLGELCLSPIGLSMVSKLAPLRFASLLMGAWFLCTAAANFLAGFIGSFIGEGEEQVENALSIFAGFGISGILIAVVLYFISDKLVDWMHGAEGEHHTEEEIIEEELETSASR